MEDVQGQQPIPPRSTKLAKIFPNLDEKIHDKRWLHHYTSADGVLKILTAARVVDRDYRRMAPGFWAASSKVNEPADERTLQQFDPEHQAIFATSVRFMNDQMEFRHAMDMLIDRFKFRRSEAALRDDASSIEIVRFVDELFKEMDSFEHPTATCVACFSEKEDDLSQWRHYGRGMGGYSIGIHARDLLALTQQQPGFSLCRCVYSAREQRKIVREFVDDVIAIYQAGRFRDWGNGLFRQMILGPILTQMGAIGSAFKHSGFKVENEWRVVFSSRSVAQGMYGPEFSFRALPMGIAPYVKFRLVLAGKSCPPPLRIMVGPSLDATASVRALERFLRTVNVSAAVTPSRTPVRPT